MEDAVKSVIVKNGVVAFSGTLLFGKFVLVTSHVVKCAAKAIEFKKCFGASVDGDGDGECGPFWILDKSGDYFETHEAFLIGDLCADATKVLLNRFSDTGVHDYATSERDVGELGTVYVLSFKRSAHVQELVELWRLHGCESTRTAEALEITDGIYVRAAPFGSRQLHNSYAQGIVSNRVGGVLLSDCPTVFGCEGGVVIAKQNNVPVGVVTCSMVGWRGECTGLTLAVTFDAIFPTLTAKRAPDANVTTSDGSAGAASDALVYVISGSAWGTGICLDKRQRLILTNAHVITRDQDVFVRSGEAGTRAHVIFQAPRGAHPDLAILHCDDLSDFQRLRDIDFAHQMAQVGDPVFTLGFPLFNHQTNMAATVTRGHVSMVKEGVVMSTCAVLPGASGGALCDRQGRLIGVVTCNISDVADGRSHAYPRVNMSIPINRIEPVLRKFLQWGDVRVLQQGLLLDDTLSSNWAISKL